MRRALGVVVIVLALVGLAGCGGGGDKADAAKAAGTSDETTTTVPEAGETGAKGTNEKGKGKSSGATTTSAPAAKGGDKKAATGATTSTTVNPVDEAWFDKKFEIKVQLKETCVRPGATQTVTAWVPVGSGVGYDTTYSDGKSGIMEGHYGGNSGGFPQDDGTYTDTFTVAATAPSGQAVVLVLASHQDDGLGEGRAVFAVSDALGRCA
ncbi:MAG TPA: hypothetical protein VHF47_06585 [Acidimicrobiales bacterium]|nr:hypothetical protein [Acidimicrobiales bacterium]